MSAAQVPVVERPLSATILAPAKRSPVLVRTADQLSPFVFDPEITTIMVSLQGIRSHLGPLICLWPSYAWRQHWAWQNVTTNTIKHTTCRGVVFDYHKDVWCPAESFRHFRFMNQHKRDVSKRCMLLSVFCVSFALYCNNSFGMRHSKHFKNR